jgi:hypothetical protein
MVYSPTKPKSPLSKHENVAWKTLIKMNVENNAIRYCYGPGYKQVENYKTRQDKTIESFIDPSTGVGLLEGYSPYYLLL